MNRFFWVGLTAMAWLATAWISAPVLAQAPDVRSVPPIVMLLLDSSGSMEKVGDCACVTPSCRECMPNCGSGTPEANRWSTVVEALTGSIDNYSCTVEARTGPSYVGEPDHRYFMPHVAISGTGCNTSIECPSGLTCSADATPLSGDRGFCQQENGILDIYRERAKFGLMTFDGTSTFIGEGELMTEFDFTNRGVQNVRTPGGFSYDDPRAFSFPGCGQPYMIDNGARNEDAPAGRLVSVGLESRDDIPTINSLVQGTLLAEAMRPYGATPIAGMLADVTDYLLTHDDTRRISASGLSGDPFNQCRKRYAILLTDGQPTSDMRGAPYHCENQGIRPNHCVIRAGIQTCGCPYETPELQAAEMLATGVIDGLYVVGFNVSGDNCPAGDSACAARASQTVNTLNDLAAMGGTTSAIFADDRATLIAALTHIMDEAAPGTTTRTVPAFGATSAGTAQMQFNTGFALSTEPGAPWAGVLERRRIECDGLIPTAQPIEDRDRFHVQLNRQTTTLNSGGMARHLFTVIPPNPAQYAGRLIGSAEDGITSLGLPVPVGVTAAGPIAGDHLGFTPFTRGNAGLSDVLMDVGNVARRNEIIDWVHGLAGTERFDNRLGSIYHSSPLVVSAPSTDLLDEAYNLFRQRPEVSGRPTMVYVGSNDGILHGFVAADHTFPTGHPIEGVSVLAGEELWGFIPPMVLRGLSSALDSHQWLVDGSPVVRDLFFARDPTAPDDGNSYHTVLMSGMRGGANGFVALDVTDPVNPEFLWQYTDALFGNTFGQPTAGQVLVDIAGVLHERAVVLLPGGRGETRNTGSCSATRESPDSGTDATPTGGRGSRRCWTARGRGLVALDVGTGRVLRRWDQGTFPSPLSGGISMFLGETGTTATRAFFTDADGVMWHLDMSNSDPSNWEVVAFHDIFHDMPFNAGQPAYPAPVISTDHNGQVVVLQGTGDIDRLEDYTNINRVVSVTEEIVRHATTGIVEDINSHLNWEITLAPGEQVTGPVDLFQGNLYFGSFRSTSDSTNACEVGASRIWGVDYLESDGFGNPNSALESTAGSGIFDRSFIDDTISAELRNQIVMGVAVTQRPTCIQGRSVTETDPYIGSRQTFRVDAASPPRFELVAQLSGGGTGVDGASVGEFVRELPAPIAYTQTVGYSGTVD